MRNNNLAEFIDSLVECGKILVPFGNIRAIRALGNPDGKGVEIILHGGDTYVQPDITYEEFKERLSETRKTFVRSLPLPPLPPSGESSTFCSLSPPPPPKRIIKEGVNIKNPATPPPPPATTRIERVIIPIDNLDLGSAQGQLPHQGIVNRRTICIVDDLGQILGTGHSDGMGTITGSNVSGIVFSNGNYQLVFKKYSQDKAFISYDIQS